jgi:hypothetical protein
VLWVTCRLYRVQIAPVILLEIPCSYNCFHYSQAVSHLFHSAPLHMFDQDLSIFCIVACGSVCISSLFGCMLYFWTYPNTFCTCSNSAVSTFPHSYLLHVVHLLECIVSCHAHQLFSQVHFHPQCCVIEVAFFLDNSFSVLGSYKSHLKIVVHPFHRAALVCNFCTIDAN